MIQYIFDLDHYKVVLEKVRRADSLLWIGTADIKDLYVKSGLNTDPFFRSYSQSYKERRRSPTYSCQRTGSGFS